MTETCQDVKRIPLPKNVTDREFWLDCFQNFATTLMAAALEKGVCEDARQEIKCAILTGYIETAATLADTALNEALFRQWLVSSDKSNKGRKPSMATLFKQWLATQEQPTKPMKRFGPKRKR